MAAIEEFSVGYPVKFWTGGDTTRDAFGKQIQEIERIYGILNALGTGKASYEEIASAVGSHKYEANPHPNWKPSMSFSDLAGSIDGSKVIGKLLNANIDAGKVNGLEDYVKGLIPDTSGDNESGIIDSSLNGNGYIKFGNGLMFQWGICSLKENILKEYKGNPEGDSWSDVYGAMCQAKFPTVFPSKCLNVIAIPTNKLLQYFMFFVDHNTITTSGFNFYYTHEFFSPFANDAIKEAVEIHFIAIGV